MNHTTISIFQAAVVICLVSIGTVFFPVAGLVVPIAGEAGWLAVFLGFAIAVPWLLMSISIVKASSASSWPAAVKEWLGLWLGRAFALYMAVTWIMLAGGLLLQAGVIFNRIAMPNTPIITLVGTMIILVILTDLRGIEVYGRTLQIFLPIIFMLVIAFLLGVGPFSLDNLRPIFGEPFGRWAHATYLVLPWAMEGIIFALFLGVHADRKKNMAPFFIGALLTAGLALATVVVMTLGVLGRNVTETYVYPTVALAQFARPGSFLEGAELFLMPLWFIFSYAKVSASFMIASQSIGALHPSFKQPYRAIFLAIITWLITTLPESGLEMVALLARIDNTFFMAFYLLIPLLFIKVQWFGKGRKKRKGSNG